MKRKNEKKQKKNNVYTYTHVYISLNAYMYLHSLLPSLVYPFVQYSPNSFIIYYSLKTILSLTLIDLSPFFIYLKISTIN